MRILVVIVSAAFLFSCQHEKLKYEKAYFDFDSLVSSQVAALGNRKARLIKKTSLNMAKDSTQIVPDTTQWQREFDSFRQLDVINKPLYKGNYFIVNQKDEHSNLKVRSYTAKIKSTVPSLRFFYLDDVKKLRRIEAVFEEGNIVYSTARKLTMEFEEQGPGLVVMNYQVKGFQKMIMSDTVRFLIDGKLIY